MGGTGARELLREGLLGDVSILLAPWAAAGEQREGDSREGDSREGDSLARAMAQACSFLGAELHCCAAPAGEAELLQALRDAPQPDVLVVDSASIFASHAAAEAREGAAGARAALASCMQLTWEITRTVVNAAFIER